MRKRGLAVAAAVVGLAAFALAVRARFLLGDPYPFGLDGYYYAVQVRSLCESGALNYPTAPLSFYFLAPFAWFAGPIAGAKLGAAAGTALLVVPVYLLGKRFTGQRAPALVGCAFAATSLQGFLLSAEFVKEGLGVTVAAFALVALFAALDVPTRARIGGALLLVLIAALTHKTSLAIVFVGFAPATAFALRTQRRTLVVVVVALAALCVLGGALAPTRFIGAADLASLAAVARGPLDLTLPTLTAGAPLRLGHEPVLLALVVAALLVLELGRPASGRLPREALGLLLLALIVCWPWLDVRDPKGLGFRLRLLAHLPLALLVGLVTARLLEHAPQRVRAPFVAGVALGLLLSRPTALHEGVARTHPTLVAAVRALAGKVPVGSTVITPDRKVAFMARYHARQPMRLHPPARLDVERTFRLIPRDSMRLELRAAFSALRAAPMPGVAPLVDLHLLEPNGLVLIPERTWQLVLGRLSAPTRRHHRAWPTS